MRLYLVRRTRSFIKTHYAEMDSISNRKYLSFADGSKSYFPDRIPKKVEYSFQADDESDQYAKLYIDGDDSNISFIKEPKEYLIRAKQVYEYYLDKYKSRFAWIQSGLFKTELKKSLNKDCKEILKILELSKGWKVEEDRQLIIVIHFYQRMESRRSSSLEDV